MGYIEVFEEKKVKDDCSTCLYRGSNGYTCAHANNKGKPMIYINGGKGCGNYWLDQNRFTRV